MRKVAVCIKQIPLVEDANFDPVTRTIRRDGVNVMSAYDLRAVAQAVALKRQFGAETTVVTMGPPQAREVLIDSIGMGIDRAVHLCDRTFAGSDTLATARALAMWLKQGDFDLVLLGKYSLDAETGQVGPEVAELLGFAQIAGVCKLRIEDHSIIAERESDEGIDEVQCSMPAVLTCAERLIAPIRVDPAAREAAQSTAAIMTVAGADLSTNAKLFGFAGSPTWVQEVRVQETPKVQCKMIEGAEPEIAVENLIAALETRGALEPRKRQRRTITPTIRPRRRGRDLWVAVETNLAGEITLGSRELLSCADGLANQLGGAVVAVGFPGAVRQHERMLASYGADQIIALDHAALESYSPDIVAAAMAGQVQQGTPWGLLLCASERGRDWGPRLAALLGLGLTGDAIGLELDGEGRLVAMKPAFGGNIVAPILSKTYPQMATVRQGMLELAEPSPSRRAEVMTVRPELGRPLTRLIKSRSNLDNSLAPLEGAEVVVGVGTGVGGPPGVEKAKEFARVLGAGLCATRRVTDQGWVPRQLQVGLTGKAIEPRLYFAIGVRGVPNHTVGIKRAQTVVAINNDPEAAIFERADFGLVGHWEPLTDALIRAFRRRREAQAARVRGDL